MYNHLYTYGVVFTFAMQLKRFDGKVSLRLFSIMSCMICECESSCIREWWSAFMLQPSILGRAVNHHN